MIAHVAQVESTTQGNVTPSPLDIAAWKDRREQRIEHNRQSSNQGTDADWVAWFNRAALDELANPVLIPPSTPPKKPMPGTPQQQSRYIHEFVDRSNPTLTAFVRAMRYKSVHGVYPDGKRSAPDVPSVADINVLKWAMGQNNPCKYLKWYRQIDPSAFAEFAESHPGFRNLVPTNGGEA